jgi:hypothetical protein
MTQGTLTTRLFYFKIYYPAQNARHFYARQELANQGKSLAS